MPCAACGTACEKAPYITGSGSLRTHDVRCGQKSRVPFPSVCVAFSQENGIVLTKRSAKFWQKK